MNFLKVFSLFIAICSVSGAYADDITCMDGHNDQAANLVGKAIELNITAAMKKKGITIDWQKSTFEISASQVIFSYDGDYGYFSISDPSVVSSDGTEFVAEYKQVGFLKAEDAVNAYYKPILKSSGFDHEGNAINGHCTLVADDVGVDNRAEFINISNAHTGRFIVRVELPKKVSLF